MSALADNGLTIAEMVAMMSAGERAALGAQLARDNNVRDKSYLELPMGREVGRYLAAKKKRLTALSQRDWESSLDKFARFFWNVHSVSEFEPPTGTRLVEEYLDQHWGHRAPTTYNKHLSITKDFFKHQIIRGYMQGDPTRAIEPAKRRQLYRETFSGDQRRAIIAAAEELRDRIALRLMFDVALRNGTLRAVQFKHFDYARRRLTIFSKGGKVSEKPIPDEAFWMDLRLLELDIEAQPNHYLMPLNRGNQKKRVLDPSKPMGGHGFHDWWYQRLEDAGVVPRGTRSGERPHKARHTSGQRMLDATKGDLKAAQKHLGHASIQTTADIYVDYDVDRQAVFMSQMLSEDDDA